MLQSKMFLLYNKKDMIPCFNIVVCDEMGYLEKQVVLKTLWEVGCGMWDGLLEKVTDLTHQSTKTH